MVRLSGRAAESHLNGGRCREGLREADHAHVVRILLQAAGVLVAAVQAGQAGLLVLHSPAGVPARVSFAAGQLGVLLRIDNVKGTGELFVCLFF